MQTPAAAWSDPDMAFSSSTGHNLTMASGGITRYSQMVFLSIFKSPDPPLFTVLKLFLFLSHLSTPYLHIVVAGAAGHMMGRVTCLSNPKIAMEINTWPKLNTAQENCNST